MNAPLATTELPGTLRDIERVKELREQMDRNKLAFAVQAERIERDKARLLSAVREFLDLCPRMNDDDPIAPALAFHCGAVRVLLREMGEKA